MTNKEKASCQNDAWLPFAKMTKAQQAVLLSAPHRAVQVLDCSGQWQYKCVDYFTPAGIYRIDPLAKTEPSKPLRYEVRPTPGVGSRLGPALYTIEPSTKHVGPGLLDAAGLVRFIEYEYPDGSRSPDFTRSKGIPVAVWFDNQES